MRERQSLLHTTQMKLKEGRVEVFWRRSRFSSAFRWRFTSAFSIPSFTVPLQEARSHTASSQLFGSILDTLRSFLHAFLNRRAVHPNVPTLVNWPYRPFLEMRPSSMLWPCPSHLRRCWLSTEYMLGFQHVTVSHCWWRGLATWRQGCAWGIVDGKSSSDVPVSCRCTKFHCRQ